MRKSNRIMGAATAAIILFAIVNVCTTHSIQDSVRSVEKNIFKVMTPITGAFIDNEFLELELMSKTDSLMAIPVVDAYLNAWNNSEAPKFLSKVFAPTIDKYENMDLDSILSGEGITFNPETGNYIDYIGDLEYQENEEIIENDELNDDSIEYIDSEGYNEY